MAAKSQCDAPDATLPARGRVSNADVVRACIGLLVLGKSDFDAIEDYILILYHVMRQRLKHAGSVLSPDAPLADLRHTAYDQH